MNHPQVCGTHKHGLHVNVVRLDQEWEGVVFDEKAHRIVYTWADTSEERAWEMCGNFIACWLGGCNP